MKLIWEEVEQAIREREAVVFIGYSLPSYDEFSMASLRRGTAGKQIEVYARTRETLQHYREMLGRIASIDPYAKPFVLQ